MTQNDLASGTAAVRRLVDTAGYGSFVSDDVCKQIAWAVIEAVDEHRKQREAKNEQK